MEQVGIRERRTAGLGVSISLPKAWDECERTPYHHDEAAVQGVCAKHIRNKYHAHIVHQYNLWILELNVLLLGDLVVLGFWAERATTKSSW